MSSNEKGNGKFSGLKDKVLDFIESLKADKKKLVVVILIVLFCFIFIKGCVDKVSDGNGGFQMNLDAASGAGYSTEDQEGTNETQGNL